MNVESQRAIAVIVSKAPPLTREQIAVLNGVFGIESALSCAPIAPREEPPVAAVVEDYFSRGFVAKPAQKRCRPRVERAPVGHWPSGVYFIKGPAGIKIGVSGNPAGRLNGLVNGSGLDMSIMHVIPVDVSENWYRLEAVLHAKWINDRGIGEWFNETPRLVAFIDQLKGCESVADQLRLCRES